MVKQTPGKQVGAFAGVAGPIRRIVAPPEIGQLKMLGEIEIHVGKRVD